MTTTAFLGVPVTLSALSRYEASSKKIGFLHTINGYCSAIQRRTKLPLIVEKDLIFGRRRRKQTSFAVVVKANQGDGGGGGSGGGWDKENTRRVLGNLALAAGLTYLSFTGQLGWILDAIVSIWLLAVLVPIVGLGIFFWYAGRDIVQSSCPNCGNDFQILRSSLNDGIQLCPYCTQPFTVEGNKFVRESANFSSGRTKKSGRQVYNGFSRGSEKAAASSTTAVVDIEAEVKDVE